MRPSILLAIACAFTLCGVCAAQSVALTGMLGSKALLVVEGGTPKSVAVGETYQGVKLISAQANQVVVEISGTRQTLVLGAAPLSLGPTSGSAESGGNGRIVLQAAGNGHFFTLGQINGGSVNFLVDTGASYVALSAGDAQRLGINLTNAPTGVMGTANGSTMAWRVKLSSVRVGNVTVHEVDAVVLPTSLPHALLGNSFLTRFQMTRTNDQMVLERRY